MSEEIALAFPCEGHTLVGVVHQPPGDPLTGVVVVVGGPQYRVGSHRQFVHLARSLAAAGIAVLRFDCRGMGDSEGNFPGFENLDDDIRAALDAFTAQLPSLKRLVLWGLCDGASAASFYAPNDARVAGLALLNPWVRTEQGEVRAYLKHYYLKRLVSVDFWRKLFAGRFDAAGALRSFRNMLAKSSGEAQADANAQPVPAQASRAQPEALPERVFGGLAQFTGPVLLLTSGRDLTAAEFLDAGARTRRRRRLLASRRISRHTLSEADHTLSCEQWKDQAASLTLNWLQSL